VIVSGNELEYGVGSGITWYSTQVDEKKEWWQKTTFLRQATCDFQLLETLRLEQGQWVNLDDHLARMAQAASYFSYVFDPERARGVLATLASQHKQDIFRARCLLNADGEFNVELHPFEVSNAPVQLRLANAPMNATPEFILHKTTHRPEYDHFLDQAQGAFDVLLFNESGDLTETCRCNLVVKIQGELLTPQICSSTSIYLLPGVLRARLLRENTIRQARLNVQDLQRAEQVWVINSLRGWVPVFAVLGTKGEVLFSHNQQ
jgi:para-aminobenzoate synthetase/4-amino-4-deoxychorismate lyase